MIYVNKERIIDSQEWKIIYEKCGLNERLLTASTIVIKPNFAAGTYVDPKTHVISDLDLLRSTIEYIVSVNKNVVIFVAEADSTGYGFAYLKFEHLGLPDSIGLSTEALKQVRLLDLSRDRLRKCKSTKLRRYTNIDSQLWLSEQLLSADLIINLSNLKTHAVTGYTGACKNLFGCLPDFEKYHNHPYIHNTIHDLTIAIAPNLNIIDAFYGMEKNGPVQGRDIDSGYRVISDNAVEADIFASSSIGYDPRKIKYIKYLCLTENISYANKSKVIRKYEKPALFLRIMNCIGLGIQKAGIKIENFGHRIHSCPTILILCITILRPILLKMFNYEKLREWKRRIFK